MDGFNIGKGFEWFIELFIVLGIVVVLGIGYFVYDLFTEDKIVSDHRIEPEIELVIKNNEVDTLYIYRNH